MSFKPLKVGELARRTGLTVRTLHHYDEIGLLRPSARTASGHRLYTAEDIARLQRVLSLRQLGFSLDEARECLQRPRFSAIEVIRLHVEKLRERIDVQQRLCTRLELLAGRLDGAADVTADDLLTAIEEMTMMEKLYTPEQMKQFQEAGEAVGQNEIEAVQEGWTELLSEMRSKPLPDPTSDEAQEIGRRWEELTQRTMRGFQAYPELQSAIKQNYQQGKFEGHEGAPQRAEFEFIEAVKAARARRAE